MPSLLPPWSLLYIRQIFNLLCLQSCCPVSTYPTYSYQLPIENMCDYATSLFMRPQWLSKGFRVKSKCSSFSNVPWPSPYVTVNQTFLCSTPPGPNVMRTLTSTPCLNFMSSAGWRATVPSTMPTYNKAQLIFDKFIGTTKPNFSGYLYFKP